MPAIKQRSFGLAIDDVSHYWIMMFQEGNRTLFKNLGKVYLHILQRLTLALVY